MCDIGEEYEQLLGRKLNPIAGSPEVAMFSSVTGTLKTDTTDALYWKINMISPVRFDEATRAMLSQENGPNFLIEIGSSGALAGPTSQVKKSLPGQGAQISYCAAWARGVDAAKALYDVAGRLFVAGDSVDLTRVNQYDVGERPRTIIDLPNYVWNHSTKYWHENAASKDWRFKKYVNHDLLGSKVLGTSWTHPTWRKILNLADVPWLKDHKMGSDVLMPGSGFIAMGVEAMFQKRKALGEEAISSLTANDLCYRFRNVRFEKALVLEEDKDTTVIVSLTPQHGSQDWHEFRVSSTAEEVTIEHCHGLVRLQDPVDEVIEGSRAGPLKFPTTGHLWYKAQSEIGYGFGTAFQKLLEVESTSGQRHARSIVSLTPPSSNWSPQSYYPVHPAALDGCFQTVTPALWAGERSSLNAVVVPSLIDSLVVNKVPASLQEGLSLAKSEYSGRGRLEEAKSHIANCSVHDHQLDNLPAATAGDKIQFVLDLIAHKKPRVRVLEVLDSADDSSLWLDGGDWSSHVAYAAYTCTAVNPKNLVSVQAKHEASRDTEFHLLDSSKAILGFPEDGHAYDLLVVRSSEKPLLAVDEVLANLKSRLARRAFILVLRSTRAELGWATNSNSGSEDSVSEPPTGLQTPRESDILLHSSPEVALPGTPASSVSEIGGTGGVEKTNTTLDQTDHSVVSKTVPELLSGQGLNKILEVVSDSTVTAYLSILEHPPMDHPPAARNVHIVRLTNSTEGLPRSLRDALQSAGWHATEDDAGLGREDIQANTDAILVLDELWTPILSQATPAQWQAIQALVSSGKQLLWVTQGSQVDRVTNPEKALAQGLFRVARMEDKRARLATLDVAEADGPATSWAIEAVLRSLVDGREHGNMFVDTEFAERDGVIHVHRVVPDARINAFRKDEREGAELVVKSLYGTKVPVSLRAERMGAFQGLVWVETATEEVPVEEGKVEVEVVAAGVNFKDVAVTMGIVPENEYTLGYEAAGLVKRLGAGVTKFKQGDRVCFLNNGSYANRLQVPVGRAHAIPDWMTFEEAATIPSVYLASIYSLFNIANLKEGQLARYKKAKIFVTVGTEEKRKFLIDNHSIDPDHIFSSRNTDFAKSILRLTHGRGVDVILNSLTGEMLDESWRICADGGTFVETGKKDIVDRSMLSLELLDRNCSFRAMDFCNTKDISDPLIDSGRHVGKVVISRGDKDVQVPIRPPTRQLALRPDASYLIAGGLKGLCGNLAIYMAKHGARRIIVCSRSGLSDNASRKTVQNCPSYGCEVVEARGDVADEIFVRTLFQQASPPIAGVFQGAMILRDKPFETMTHGDFHMAIHAKIHGTWALHRASLSQSRPLDFFTFLSSISGIVGKKGQANYSAANTFLDAFASYRHSLGLRANTVDLGLIEDVGYVAEQGGMGSHFDKRQWTPIREGMLRQILGLSILQQAEEPVSAGSTAQLVTGVGFPLPEDSDLKREARFAYLFAAGSGGSTAGGGGDGSSGGDQTLRAFEMMHKSGAEAAALAGLAQELLAAQFTRILRLETAMEPAKPLMAYGLDSLAAVELRNWVRSELGAELTTLDITNASSLIALGEKLVAKLPSA
ncbi:hypothetical protein VTI74DRAFT_5750 [Chaetomium olivicolor]